MKPWQRKALARPCYLAIETLLFAVDRVDEGCTRKVTVNAGYE